MSDWEFGSLEDWYDDSMEEESLNQEEILDELEGDYREFALLIRHLMNSLPKKKIEGFDLTSISTNALSKAFKEEISKKIKNAENRGDHTLLEMENDIYLEVPNDVFYALERLFNEMYI